MILHEPAIISEDLLEKNFICDLDKCKGACCIEGDSGAPVTEEEITLLENEFDAIEPFLTEAGAKAIRKKGVYETDKRDGE